MKLEDLRKAFLDYFASKGHEVVASSSLIPAGDPTLLFVNAGMVQFKDCFLGTDKRSYNRATTCQKSIRISGKHNDLENVGRTARHHTFFEMLGNFSFGDYFKEDAIKFGWEFLTEVLKLDKNRLWVTIYEDDDEAEELWKKHTDVFDGRILRCGKEDNFWAMGDTGPCGPCSEIHYYIGDEVDGQSENEFRLSDTKYIEVWNLVFMQFNRDAAGNLSPLPKPSVDTGMGLERIAAVKQGVLSNYDTNLLRNIIAKVEKLSGKTYDGADYSPREDAQYHDDVAMRVICDHSRASAFLITDDILPSSDGRGYVLRRLIRRACRHGRVLGLKKAFLFEIAEEVVEQMGPAYPELIECKEKILKILKAEEEKFLQTLDTGISILEKEVKAVKAKSLTTLSGEVAFTLHDTYGFPLDMTEDIVQGLGLALDHQGFTREMEKQRERSRSARSEDTELILQRAVKATETKFLGYEFNEYESEVLGLYDSSGELKSAKEGQEIALVAKKTPFYAESGGQVGDTGSISSNNYSLEVIDTLKAGGDTIVHICRVSDGEVKAGTNARFEIDAKRREKLRVNHSATHLLHLGLRTVLGDHIKQAGSRVSDQSLRFDFTHAEPITDEQLHEIEMIANQEALANHQVLTDILPIEEAKESGAVALFGEKYGDLVRVVQIGPRSREFCGGTHAAYSGNIGLIKIFSEGSISAGVRRIEAAAGISAYQQTFSQWKLIKSLGDVLRTGEADMLERFSKVVEKNKKLEQELEQIRSKLAVNEGGDLSKQAQVLEDGTKVLAHVIEKANPKQLREMADDLKQRLGSGCIALASVSEGKAILLTAVTEDLTSKHNAGEIIKEMSKIVGSRGGGRADLAQAGGGDPEKIDQALDRFREFFA